MMKIKKTVKASLFTLMLAFMAIGTIAVAAVMKTEKAPKTDPTGFFYRYTSNSTLPEDIENIYNYERSDDACPSGTLHVCGVYLPSDATFGEKPDSDEFDAVVDDLLESEAGNSSANDDIIMKN